jgi:signal transduction histidine kinase
MNPVSPDDERKFIEPFQAGNAVESGAGHGLSIVQEIMAAHGGEFIITSTPGGGTTTSLRFPEATTMPDETRSDSVATA